MKTTGSTHRPTLINAWNREPNAKDAVLHRIQKITRELAGIQSEMHGQLTASAATKKAGFFEDSSAVAVLNDFKAELDQLRRILWFYIEEAAARAVTVTDQDQQAHRLERVNELLRALAPQPPTPELQNQNSGSFFERLDVVIDTYMKEKKPVAAENKPGPRTDTKAFS